MMKKTKFESNEKRVLNNIKELKEDIEIMSIGSIEGFRKFKYIFKNNFFLQVELSERQSTAAKDIIYILSTIKERFVLGKESCISMYTNAYNQFELYTSKYTIESYLPSEAEIIKSNKEKENKLLIYADYIKNKYYNRREN